jgi:hypothetical protein
VLAMELDKSAGDTSVNYRAQQVCSRYEQWVWGLQKTPVMVVAQGKSMQETLVTSMAVSVSLQPP